MSLDIAEVIGRSPIDLKRAGRFRASENCHAKKVMAHLSFVAQHMACSEDLHLRIFASHVHVSSHKCHRLVALNHTPPHSPL